MIQISRSTEFSKGPDLTALIDIVFIVVVFLLLTANTSLLSLSVEVPDTDSEIDTLVNDEQQIVLSIKPSSPHWSLRIETNSNDSKAKHNNEQDYEHWENLNSALLSYANTPNTHILIATDKDANARLLLQLLAFLNEQNIRNTQILMEPES